MTPVIDKGYLEKRISELTKQHSQLVASTTAVLGAMQELRNMLQNLSGGDEENRTPDSRTDNPVL